MRPFLASRRILVVALVAIAAVGGLAASGFDDSLVYYRTPTELRAAPPSDERLRLGGMVVRGSVVADGDSVRFMLTDGASNVAVVHSGGPQGVFREGQGALVEGSVGADGVFRSDLLMVKHDNEYRPVEPEAAGFSGEGPTR